MSSAAPANARASSSGFMMVIVRCHRKDPELQSHSILVDGGCSITY